MRRVLAGMAVATLTAGAFGCGGDGEPAPTAVVEVFGPYRGVEADRFAASLEAFTERTGIAVRYTGTADFEDELARRVAEAGDPPDVALVPQPALVRELADQGFVETLPDEVVALVDDGFGPEARAFGELDGVAYGVPFRLTVKSLVWYRPSLFAEHGWEVPTTLDELDGLVDVVLDAGVTPWCLGIEAGDASGWPATDWVEDLVVRLEGTDRYREWAAAEVPFGDQGITEAFERFESLVLAPGRLPAGRPAAATTPYDQAGTRMGDDPPECALFKQADFAVSWLADGGSVGAGGDLDAFVLPGTDDDPAPLVVGGDVAVAFESRPEVTALLAHLAGPEAGAAWIEAGGYLSPRLGVGPDDYPEGVERLTASLVRDGRPLVFDASDQLPRRVGSGLLWEEITAWVAGARSYDDLAATVDAALGLDPTDAAAGDTTGEPADG